MIALLSYLHRYIIRSYKFLPPSFVFIAGIVFIYSVVPNYVMNSYAFSTTFLFIVTVILCHMFMHIEILNQQFITVVHSNSIVKVFIAKVLYCWLFTMALAVFAIFYPVVIQAFNRQPSLEELAIAIVFHSISSFLAIAITCWFNKKFIRSQMLSFFSLSLFVVLTLASHGIGQSLPAEIMPIIYVLPPLNNMIDVLVNYDTVTWSYKAITLAGSFFYGLIFMLAFFYMINKKRL